MVLGADNIALHAPSRDSYIDVRDYDSPAALAAHLRYLDGNDTAFEEYMAWHDRPFSQYGAGFAEPILRSLPIAQREHNPKVGNLYFGCNLCEGMAAWEAEGRPMNRPIPPFHCEVPVAIDAAGKATFPEARRPPRWTVKDWPAA